MENFILNHMEPMFQLDFILPYTYSHHNNSGRCDGECDSAHYVYAEQVAQ